MARGEIQASGRSFRRVLAAFPNELAALQMYVHTLGWLVGKPAAWPPLVDRLKALDPLGTVSHLVSAMALLFAGRFAEAVDAARQMVALDPVTPVFRANLVMALSYNGQLDEAEALAERVEAHPDSDVGTWWAGLFRAAWRKDRAEVVRLSNGPHRQTAMWDAELPWALAAAHAAVDLREDALFWLERAIDGGMINHPFLAGHDRYLDGIRGDPRFDRAMERARRAWEAFET
jgi:tetratricopeptide (TPR) repeat protein